MARSILRARNHLLRVRSTRWMWLWLVVAVCPALGSARGAEEGAADPNRVVAQAELIARMTAENQASRAEAVLWAEQYGYPIRFQDDSRVCELMAVWDDRPVYYVTDNVNAAVATAADRIRDMVPWQLDGSGVIVGVWDESIARTTHREFLDPAGQPRVRAGDRGSVSAHTTHVTGTIAATGIDPTARGMAPATAVQSFNWTYDASKMAIWTAYTQAQTNAIYVSNHSYGFVGGWIRLSDPNVTGHTGWHWTGLWAGPKSSDDWFGAYHSIARQWDDVTYTKNYYLAFAAAGNDREDNPPPGETVYYSKSRIWYPIVYSPDTCPPGDGFARGGYNTICGPGVAKNIMTVGAVGDAVFNGARSLADANMAGFSSWGPTTDGRIKPDIVANGIKLYSTDSNSDDSYETHSGTSMASPNATGSAALLVQLYHRLFPGKSMRASTLKGLIIHTADDLGRPGPDYQFGWGLMNARAAAEMIQRQHDEPAGNVLVEGRLTSNIPADDNPDDAYYFWANAKEPIRVTLCWTDPPGVYITDFTNASPRLIHDLDLRVTGPSGSTTYYPYILNPADPCAIATTGDNKRDNVEQVYIGAPSEAGLYKVQINYKTSLATNEQYYSVISSVPLSAQRPPVAEDAAIYTAVSTPVTITLKATDDGLPKPPATLAYTIASLPRHGSLTLPTGAPISQPGELPNNAGQIVYTPVGAYTGDDSFLFYADDGGTAPNAGMSNTAAVLISVKNVVLREYAVTASADDGSVDRWTGHQSTADNYLKVGQYVSAMRFQSIDVPPGARIAGAFVRLRSAMARGINGSINAEATGNAADLAGENRSILGMTRTQAKVAWTWTGSELADTWYASPDCSAVIQEIVGRPDWKAGNAILLVFSGTRVGWKNNDAVFYSRDYSAEFAPRLEITYMARSSASAGPGRNPPTAASMDIYVSANMPVSILFDATDDGLPESACFAIQSPPIHGSLTFLDGTPVKSPMAQAVSANRVIYTPDAGFSGNDWFTFCADDGGAPPTGGKSNTATVTLKVRHMVTREYQVIAQEDDAYGADANAVVFSETLSVGRHSSAMRFRNIDVTQASEIISARLKISMDTTSVQKRIDGTLYAEAVRDANDFSRPNLRIPELPRTQASVPWAWQTGQTWPRQAYRSSPDIHEVVQEVVDRPDWMSGNSMAVLYMGDVSNDRDLRFFACDTLYSHRAAKLEITCTMAPSEPGRSQYRGTEHPPRAKNINLTVSSTESVTIPLEATDDGLPAPPGKLTYTIASLPRRGTLEVLSGSQISAVPRTLPDVERDVVYRPDPRFDGSDSFTFYADDGGTAPAGGKSNTATVTISVRGPVPVAQPSDFWQFEEGSGDLAHDSVGRQHGSVVGAQWTAGRVGGALAFDGVDDYVALPYNSPVWLPQNDFTVAFWIYFNKGDAFEYVATNEMIANLNCAKSSNPANELGVNILRLGGSRKIAFQMTTLANSDEDLWTKTVFDKDKWYHVTAVRTGGLQQIYVDGELDNSRGCSSSPIDFVGAWDNDTVYLGVYSTTMHRTYYLNGKLDEVALFYRGLSAEEVRQFYERR